MKLRVRSLCGVELVLDVPHHSVHVQVAEVKRLALAQLLAMHDHEARREHEETKENEADDTKTDELSPRVERMMAVSCIAFRGQLLADSDDVNLFALAPSDFFVLIEDDEHESDGDAEDDVEIIDAPSGETRTGTKRAKHANGLPSSVAKQVIIQDEHVSQLMDMGFAFDQTREALQQANGVLETAVAILMGESDPEATTQTETDQSNRKLEEFVAKMVRDHPELLPLKMLLQEQRMHTLKRLAMESDFEALVLLKESLPPRFIDMMNANVPATVSFLSTPALFVEPPRIRQTVDLTDGAGTAKASAAKRMHDHEAIEKLTAMGFELDIVVAMFESCGRNEALTASVLLETMMDQ